MADDWCQCGEATLSAKCAACGRYARPMADEPERAVFSPRARILADIAAECEKIGEFKDESFRHGGRWHPDMLDEILFAQRASLVRLGALAVVRIEALDRKASNG